MTRTMPRSLVLAGFVTAATAMACDKIPVHMHTESHVQHLDGRVEHKSSDWHGTLDQLPEQLAKAGSELGSVTAQLAKELTDVPPPGKVALRDLSPALAKYDGQRGADFLVSARDADGKPITFEYVRLGVPQYDEFFKTAQEVYALVYQTTQCIGQMRQISSKLLETKVDEANLRAEVDRALEARGHTGAVASLKRMEEMAASLAVLVPQIASKLGKLAQAGEALVVAAPSSLTNPKVVAHLDLVKDGLVKSVKVIKESASLMLDSGKTLGGFRA